MASATEGRGVLTETKSIRLALDGFTLPAHELVGKIRVAAAYEALADFLRIGRVNSMPVRAYVADSNYLKLRMGLVLRLTARWFFSAMTLRYFHFRTAYR